MIGRIMRDATQIMAFAVTMGPNSTGTSLDIGIPPGSVWTFDDANGAGLAAGTYVYKLQIGTGFSNNTVSVGSVKLIAWEL